MWQKYFLIAWAIATVATGVLYGKAVKDVRRLNAQVVELSLKADFLDRQNLALAKIIDTNKCFTKRGK